MTHLASDASGNATPTEHEVAAHVADQLEASLGDPWNPAQPVSLRRAMVDDETESFPADAAAALDDMGLPAWYVPAELGGRLVSQQSLLAVVRTIARRDLTLVIGHAKTYLGAAAIWLAGRPDQQQKLAGRVLAGTPVSLALTERAHGADLLASEVQALRHAGGWRLHGEKWLINNATRGGCLTVLANTNPDRGFRGCSFFLVDKTRLAADQFAHLPKVRTLGIRGADISGIRFDNAALDNDALIGNEGQGLEIAMKLLQLTRTGCAGLSLGAADTGLRTVLDFARSRRLYGASVWDLGHARPALSDVAADLMALDCLAWASSRAIHWAPEQMALHAAVTKFLVPNRTEDIFQRLSVVLGARYYLREEHAWGIFQKMLRDQLLVGLFDGSTVVNLHALGVLVRGLGEPRDGDPRVLGWSALDGPLPPLRPDRLDVGCRRSIVADGLAEALGELPRWQLRPGVIDAAKRVAEALEATRVAVRTLHAQAPAAFARSPALFDLARRYAVLHAAACVVHVLRANPTTHGPDGAAWAAVALPRLLELAGFPTGRADDDAREACAVHLAAQHDADQPFSVLAWALPPRAR